MANKIDKNTDIVISSNVKSSYSYDNHRGLIIDLEDHGDEMTVTFAELKSMASGKDKRALQKMYLLITDIISEEFTVNDVIDQLRLTKFYDKAKKILQTDEITVDSFDDFVESCSAKELSAALEDRDLFSMLADSIVYLDREGRIKDEKIRLLLDRINNVNLYEYREDTENLR